MLENVISDVKKVLVYAEEHEYIEWGNAGLQALCRSAWNSKADLRALLSKHKNWSEERQAIVFDFEEERRADLYAAKCVMENIANYVNDVGTNEHKSFMYDFIYSVAGNDITDGTLNNLRQRQDKIDEFRIRVGQKVTKVFRKILDKYVAEKVLVLPDERKYYEREYAKFADFMKPAILKRKLLLSINPADFLMMSAGNSWSSCHYFDGCHSAGTTSYALDDVSMILFTLSDNSKLDVLEGKIDRQIYGYKDHQILQSRLYPKYEDTEKSAQFRHIVEEIFCDVTGDPNSWFLFKSKDNYNLYNVSGLHYPDYDYSEYNTRFCVNKAYLGQELQKMAIGSYGCCLKCGEELSDSDGLVCEDCKENTHYCEYCGEWHRESEMSEVVYNESWAWICDEHIDYKDVIRCDECGDYFSTDYITATKDGQEFCNKCLYERAFFCEECEEWCGYDHSDEYSAVNKYGDIITICDDCIEDYELCEHCGTYYKDLKDGCCPHCGVVIEEESEEESETA